MVTDEVRRAIGDAGGLLRFDEFMRLALYGEDGFYNAGGRAGRRGGHFLTSPEVGPLFGAVLAQAIDGWWRQLGAPADFTVIEVGAGPGTLARAILAAEPACTPRYVAVEASAAQRADHPDGVDSRAELPQPGGPGVVIANELLDNLPFRLAVFDGGWREAFVAADGDALREVLATPLDPVPPWLPSTAPHGARAPIQDDAADWVRRATGVIEAGRLVAIDYAVARTAELAQRPWREWLRTFAGHERGGHYLRDPGTQDITNEVCVDQLPTPDAVRTQAQFLAAAWHRRAGRARPRGVARPDLGADHPHPDDAQSRPRERGAGGPGRPGRLPDPGVGSTVAIQWPVT